MPLHKSPGFSGQPGGGIFCPFISLLASVDSQGWDILPLHKSPGFSGQPGGGIFCQNFAPTQICWLQGTTTFSMTENGKVHLRTPVAAGYPSSNKKREGKSRGWAQSTRRGRERQSQQPVLKQAKWLLPPSPFFLPFMLCSQSSDLPSPSESKYRIYPLWRRGTGL